MKNSYNNVTVKSKTIQKDERLSEFTNCQFSGQFDNINFSYAVFNGCTYDSDVVFNSCNIKGAEGDSLPNLTTVKFDFIPKENILIDLKNVIISTDGISDTYEVNYLDTKIIEEKCVSSINKNRIKTAKSDKEPKLINKDNITITKGVLNHLCGYGETLYTKEEFRNIPILEVMLSESNIKAHEYAPTPVPNTLTIDIKKKTYDGIYLTTPDDNETIYISTSKGKISHTEKKLNNGELSIVFTSPPETGEARIKIKCPKMDYETEAFIEIQP